MILPRSISAKAARRRGSVTLIVVWSVAIAAIVVGATQVLSWRQAVMGREALSRVQARWAARGGIETMIAIMEYYNTHPVVDDAFALTKDLENHAVGDTETGEFDIRHFRDGVEYAGPLDEHSKLNINVATKVQLSEIPFMSPDVADSIIDWRDSNDEVEAMGAESDYYANRGVKYRPRNADFRSLAEVELVAGCWPSYVRGEDWNLNGRLDSQEDDGTTSLPDDKPDGYLDEGWSAYLTAYSRGTHTAPSGQPKLYLRMASAEQIQERTGATSDQAVALQRFARGNNARMQSLLVTPLSALGQQQTGNAGSSGRGTSGRSRGGQSGGGAPTATSTVAALDTTQLRAVFQECTLDDPFRPAPGRLNLNSASSEVLQKALGLDARAADAIISRRQSRQGGLSSVVDLMEIAELKPETLMLIGGQVDVVSNVYLISCRGRAMSTGTEVELVVIVDRSTLPVAFLEVREP